MYIKIKKARNKDGSVREYLQIVETRREEGYSYPRQRLLLNVARIDGMDKRTQKSLFNLARGILKVLGKDIDALEALPEVRKENKKFYWGLLEVSSGIWKRLELDKSFREIEQGRRNQFPLERTIFAIVAGRLYGKISESAVYRWLNKTYDGFGFKKIQKHHLYRGLDILTEEWERIEDSLRWKVLDLFHQKAEILFIDTTSLIYWGEGLSEITKYGFSKQKRGDKKQVVIGIAMINGLPVGIEIERGNITDLEVMRKMISRFREKLNLSEVCIVADNGMVSIKDIKEYNKEEWKYLVRASGRENIVKEKVKEARAGNKWEKIEEGILAKEFKVEIESGKKEWLIVVRNEAEEEHERKVRESIMEKLREKEGRDIKELVKNKGYKRYLAEGGKIKIDEKKVKEAELWDGIWVVRTNKKFLRLKEPIERYRELWRIEKVFKDLKNFLSIVPIYHSRRIRGHIYACFLSLVISFVIEKDLKQIQTTHPFEEIIEQLQDLKIEWIRVNKKKFLVRDNLEEWQEALFKREGIPIPPSVLKIA